MKKLAIICAACVIGTPSLADVHVRFMEGAPKDQFVITNTGACAIENAKIKIDFSSSDAGIVFDVTASGMGVEVFQPFEVVTGDEHLVTKPKITDGDQIATLHLSNFGPDQSIVFTMDLDDTSGSREITVSDEEIRGTMVSLALLNESYSAVMKTSSMAILVFDECLS